MPNLTLAVDEETLRRARIRALEQGTSVNAVVREFLERFAEDESQRMALQEFLEVAATSEASSGRGGRAWRREDLYDG
jgi:plasmid stability protein